MDPNQLKYKRLYNLSIDDVEYKLFLVLFKDDDKTKRLVVRACCKQEIRDSTKHKIISIREQLKS
jgi:hypothetical protein